MVSKKLLLIFAIFVSCAGGSYFIFKPNPVSQAELALERLKVGNYAGAEEALRTLSEHPSPYPIALYQGYLELARGRHLESDLYLRSLLEAPPKKFKQGVALEVLLARATNAFFEKRDLDFYPLVHSARELSAHNRFVFFFTGLGDYLRADYSEALRSWNAFAATEASEGSGWMTPVFEKFFPLTWRQLHMAHCLTEEGNLLLSREILEKESHQMDNEELTSLATLFLGLTYLKETEHIPLDERGSYYKLARFYFERSGTEERFERERELIAPHVKKEAETLLLTSLDPEKQKWGFDFVHTLHEWKADQAVESLATGLAQKLLQERESVDPVLCQAIRQEFLGSPFHQLVTQKLLDAMAYDLKRGETQDLYELWAMVELLTPNPRALTKQIASLTSQEIFRTVKRDTTALEHTRRYIAFWEKLGRSTQEREMLARELLGQAKLFWQQEHQERKGEQLMALALKMSRHRSAMEAEISSFLTTLYNRAEHSNLIGRLMCIFDAMDRFQINKQELANPSKLANHLADAEYLYHAHNYALCKAQAQWVLKLHPEHEQAQRLVGLSSFHLGEYTNAVCSLQKLNAPDEDSHKALMLSQAFASQEQEKHLAQIDNTDSFDEDE